MSRIFRAIPTPFAPACDGHALAPIARLIVVRGAKPGDVVAINPIELTPFATGTILRDFGVLRRELPEPSLPVHDGRAWFAATQPISARSRRCAGSLKPSYAALTAAISTKRTPAMFDDQLRCDE